MKGNGGPFLLSEVYVAGMRSWKRTFAVRHSAVGNAAVLLLHKRLKDCIGTILVEFDADFGPKVVR